MTVDALTAQARQLLLSEAQDMLCRLAADARPEGAAQVLSLPARVYSDPERFDLEKKRIFRRLPLMLAAGCELPGRGDYKAMEVAGVPVLLVRGGDGVVRAFVNACSHRAGPLAMGCGRATRFTCPYHGWTFADDGRLLAIAGAKEFGAVDKNRLGLTELPCEERHGLVWVTLDPEGPRDIGAYLGRFGEVLEGFGLADWTFFERRELPGANWKLAMDAHLEFYHLPVLHRDTFGTGMSNLAQYYYHGPHVRLGSFTRTERKSSRKDLLHYEGLPQSEWPLEPQLFGEFVIFPNVSINTFYRGGRSVIISQILPGATVGESITVQTHLHEASPEGEAAAEARRLCDLLAHVVGVEDLETSRRQQCAIDSGLIDQVHFGRNEGGVQHLHRWADHAISLSQITSFAEFAANGPAPPSTPACAEP